MKVAIAVLLLTFALQVGAAPGFTAAERATVSDLVAQVHAGCEEQMASVRTDAGNQPAVPRGLPELFAIQEWRGYCPCLARMFQQEITPTLLRTGTEQDDVLAVKKAATACAVVRMKEVLPSACRAMLEGMRQATSTSRDGVAADQFCGCVQRDVDRVTPASFDAFFRGTMADYADYRRTGKLASGPGPSLLGTMQRCGIGAVKSEAIE